tara:strand:+ start:77 stop:439 length:363 start_codon:yes stop_codon:yes gene_type:complete
MSKENLMGAVTPILLALSLYSQSAWAIVIQTECSLGPVSADYIYYMDTAAGIAIITYKDATLTQKYVSMNLQEKTPGKFVGNALFSSSPSGDNRVGDSFVFSYDKNTNTFEETGMKIPCN